MEFYRTKKSAPFIFAALSFGGENFCLKDNPVKNKLLISSLIAT